MAEPFVHRLRVRYAECDAQGIVFNAHYLAYVDHSITELWRTALGGYARMTEQGVDIVVAESTLRFASPARFDEQLDIAVSVGHLGTSGMTTRHVITHVPGGDCVLDARMRYVWIDTATQRKTPIPDWARERLAAYLVPEAPAR